MKHFLATIALTALLVGVSTPAIAATAIYDRVATAQGISADAAKQQVDGVFDAVRASLKENENVTIRGFGKFYVQQRDARTARNPKTGDAIKVPAKRYPKFSSSDVLKKEMNN